MQRPWVQYLVLKKNLKDVFTLKQNCEISRHCSFISQEISSLQGNGTNSPDTSILIVKYIKYHLWHHYLFICNVLCQCYPTAATQMRW